MYPLRKKRKSTREEKQWRNILITAISGTIRGARGFNEHDVSMVTKYFAVAFFLTIVLGL